jgi:lysophospholipase L1-like esterase
VIAAAAVAVLATAGGIAVATALNARPDTSGMRVAFYGDSYTLGTGASSADKRWSTIVCEQRGWVEFNPSQNGLGFVNRRDAFGDVPALIIADDPDLVIITLGLNDNFSFDIAAPDIEAAIHDDFERLSKELPDARIIVVEPFWYTDLRPDSVDTIIGWVREAAAEIDADYIPGASRWLEGHPEWIGDDGLHPSDEGYAEIARRMDAELAVPGL